jgi:hypothetical protein
MKQLLLPLKRAAKCHPERPYFVKDLCKKCYHKAHWQKRWARDKEKILARSRAFWHSTRKHQPGERRRARARARRQREENPEKFKAYLQDYHLRRTYGLTLKQRDQMFAQHGGKCWLCEERTADRIDHCHKTGKIRGALCLHCNAGLGHFLDDTGMLLKAIRYLTHGKEG